MLAAFWGRRCFSRKCIRCRLPRPRAAPPSIAKSELPQSSPARLPDDMAFSQSASYCKGAKLIAMLFSPLELQYILVHHDWERLRRVEYNSLYIDIPILIQKYIFPSVCRSVCPLTPKNTSVTFISQRIFFSNGFKTFHKTLRTPTIILNIFWSSDTIIILVALLYQCDMQCI